MQSNQLARNEPAEKPQTEATHPSSAVKEESDNTNEDNLVEPVARESESGVEDSLTLTPVPRRLLDRAMNKAESKKKLPTIPGSKKNKLPGTKNTKKLQSQVKTKQQSQGKAHGKNKDSREDEDLDLSNLEAVSEDVGKSSTTQVPKTGHLQKAPDKKKKKNLKNSDGKNADVVKPKKSKKSAESCSVTAAKQVRNDSF